jgi:DNA replication initiation complex subunit (GINS family)
VYNDVAVRLNEVQKELIANKVKAIPDTDITLRTVEDKKEKVQESLRKLRAIRSKKIVSL